jgi:hypothetical protein
VDRVRNDFQSVYWLPKQKLSKYGMFDVRCGLTQSVTGATGTAA